MASNNTGFDTGFGQDFFSAGLNHLHASLNAPVPGQENDGQATADFVQPSLETSIPSSSGMRMSSNMQPALVLGGFAKSCWPDL